MAHEFRFIIKEAKEIFAHYRVDAGRPPIESILFDQEEIMRFQSLDYVAFNENLRKKVTTNILIDRISELNDDLAIRNNEIGYSLESRLTKFCQKMLIMMNWLCNTKGRKRNLYLLKLILGTFVPLNLALLITFACLKENLLPNVENMK